ncbi:hypothetical protein DWW36_05070 [Erysipelotrichaceae bacterium AF15-26LB]|nr:LURP-one-related family protein [[Clostridium] innocuum]RJV91016.1 hypothetical protein DWX45_07570 [Erysipelotrichaceae bacterium AF19-24AC]RJV91184.1 hypothetical protein DWW36_05070 [Erysipelotrichaceae bacterium AF15-26LB]
MKLLFKQRMFSWFDSYDIYDENGNTVYTVEGRLAWGHRLIIYNAYQEQLGEIKEEVFTFLPRFRMYINDACIGYIEKEFSFFRPKFHLSCNDWTIHGNFMEWEYDVISESQGIIMQASKELFHVTDTYVLDIRQQGHALLCLMIVLAIDAAKCSKNS